MKHDMTGGFVQLNESKRSTETTSAEHRQAFVYIQDYVERENAGAIAEQEAEHETDSIQPRYSGQEAEAEVAEEPKQDEEESKCPI